VKEESFHFFHIFTGAPYMRHIELAEQCRATYLKIDQDKGGNGLREIRSSE